LITDMDPMKKAFSQMNLHHFQLVLLGNYSRIAMLKMFGAVGSARAFEVGGSSGMDVSLKPEVSFFPEQIAASKLKELSRTKSEIYEDEFEDFIMLYLEELGKKLDPPLHLAELTVEIALQNIDSRVKAEDRIDIRKVLRQLELPLDKQGDGYELNPAETKLYETLSPLAPQEPTEFEGFKPERLPFSIGCAMRYVLNKSWYYFLKQEEAEPLRETEAQKQDPPALNSLELSISQVFENSGLHVGSENRKMQPPENLEWHLKSFAGDLSWGPGNVSMGYTRENFQQGELTRLFNFPGLDNFL